MKIEMLKAELKIAHDEIARLKEALEDIKISCREDFPYDEIVTDISRIASAALSAKGEHQHEL